MPPQPLSNKTWNGFSENTSEGYIRHWSRQKVADTNLIEPVAPNKERTREWSRATGRFENKKVHDLVLSMIC